MGMHFWLMKPKKKNYLNGILGNFQGKCLITNYPCASQVVNNKKK